MATFTSALPHGARTPSTRLVRSRVKAPASDTTIGLIAACPSHPMCNRPLALADAD